LLQKTMLCVQATSLQALVRMQETNRYWALKLGADG